MGNFLADSTMHEFGLRDACMADIDDICKLGTLLNTINLPANQGELEQVIARSEASFSLAEPDSTKRAFLFALTNGLGRVIGVSQIFAQHGTLGSPHMYFQVGLEERYSETLQKYFRHQTLRLCQNFDGPTEIGSLVIAKEYRSHQKNLGRQLSFVRFLFMAMNRQFFRDQVLAELMPPLGANFDSVLWNAIGRKFTGLDYHTADMLSRKNKEFIKSLFPAGDIYVASLPDLAQAIIGQVGPQSSGAAFLLSSIGFRYSYRVDPFDGGPHFEADTADISIIKNARSGFIANDNLATYAPHDLKTGLISYFRSQLPSGQRFRAVLAPYIYAPDSRQLNLHEATSAVLDLTSGSEAWVAEI